MFIEKEWVKIDVYVYVFVCLIIYIFIELYGFWHLGYLFS